MGKILFITDRYKVSQGYEPAFTRMLNKAGIHRHEVAVSDIYGLVSNPTKKYGNEKTWKFNVDKTHEILEAFKNRVNIIKPSLIVVADPACVGIFTKWDLRSSTLDKLRGGVYDYEGIPVVITFPITAIHQRVDERLVKNDEGETDTQEPYRVQQGAWILAQDWAKVGRIHAGKQRRLPAFEYAIVRSLDDAKAALAYLRTTHLIADDIETGCWPAQITCVGYCGLHPNGTARAFVFPLYDPNKPDGVFWESESDHVEILRIIREINSLPIVKTQQNGNYDVSYFIRDRLGLEKWLLDSMGMWYSLYPELPKSLDFISSVLLDNYQYWKDDIKGSEEESASALINMERYWRYNALDCYNTLFNTLYLLKLMESNRAMQINYNDFFMRALSGLKMSMRGVKADFRRRDEHRVNLEAQRADALDRFRYLIDDPEFNVESPAQKVRLLYDFLGARPRNARGRYTKRDGVRTDAPSSGAMALKLCKTDHPLFRLIIEAMEEAMVPAKQIANVCNMKLFTDRIRTSLNAGGTETQRFSSKSSNFWDGTNLQNIRKDYRDWFVADEGNILLDVDFSQSDDVFMAYESQDPEKIKVVESGMDGHAVNGELFFKWEYDRIVAGKKAGDPLIVHPITGIRQLSKKIVHGTNFQMAAFTLYVQMGREAVVAAAELLGFKDAEKWDQERLVQLCGVMMATYRKRYKRLTKKEYYAEVSQMVAKGVIINAFGISRRMLGNASDNGTQREATAYIGQSATAANMNRAMYEIDHGYIAKDFRDGPNPDAEATPLRMSYESHGFRFMLQVHDNFLSQLSLRHPRWKEAACNLLQVMNRPVIIHGREVRVKAEAEIGLRWGKGMIEWGGDPHDLDRIVASIDTQGKLKGYLNG